VDRLSRERRSWNMGRIPSCDTRPEIIVRSALHRLGFRFRLHGKVLPGKPDIVLPKWRHVIFVHGCFWHRHSGCKKTYTPKSRIEFWSNKFEQNVARDESVQSELERLGWSVSTIWECETENPKAFSEAVRSLAKRIKRTFNLRNLP
jgi:DNA mismatch endonuclease (patch repair protein)